MNGLTNGLTNDLGRVRSVAEPQPNLCGDPYDSRVGSDAITLRLVKVHHGQVDGGIKITHILD